MHFVMRRFVQVCSKGSVRTLLEYIEPHSIRDSSIQTCDIKSATFIKYCVLTFFPCIKSHK